MLNVTKQGFTATFPDGTGYSAKWDSEPAESEIPQIRKLIELMAEKDWEDKQAAACNNGEV